jgi:hypothetical protein
MPARHRLRFRGVAFIHFDGDHVIKVTEDRGQVQALLDSAVTKRQTMIEVSLPSPAGGEPALVNPDAVRLVTDQRRPPREPLMARESTAESRSQGAPPTPGKRARRRFWPVRPKRRR